MKPTRTTAVAAAFTAGLATTVLAGAPAQATPPTTTTDHESISGVFDSCPGFDLLASGGFDSRTTTYADGRQSIHLRLVGTVTNSVTGLSGTYAEIQIDKTLPDGSGFSAGLLSKLTVPGRGSTPLYAGRVTVAPGGTMHFSPHTVGVGDPAGFHEAICGALS